jgi:hypothetical protein
MMASLEEVCLRLKPKKAVMLGVSWLLKFADLDKEETVRGMVETSMRGTSEVVYVVTSEYDRAIFERYL